MSFKAGEVHVICPSCGAPAILPVYVSSVEVETAFSADNSRLRARIDNAASAHHVCKKVDV